MRPLTFLCLISAAIFALLSLPLLFLFFPVGIACGIAGLLLAMLAIPDLVITDEPNRDVVDQMYG